MDLEELVADVWLGVAIVLGILLAPAAVAAVTIKFIGWLFGSTE